MVSVKVDAERCQGHARCFAFAPQSFDFDDEGYSFVVEGHGQYDGEIPKDMTLAITNCPERAIVVTEDAAG